MKIKVGVSGDFFKGTTWIKQEDSEYLAKYKKREANILEMLPHKMIHYM